MNDLETRLTAELVVEGNEVPAAQGDRVRLHPMPLSKTRSPILVAIAAAGVVIAGVVAVGLVRGLTPTGPSAGESQEPLFPVDEMIVETPAPMFRGVSGPEPLVNAAPEARPVPFVRQGDDPTYPSGIGRIPEQLVYLGAIDEELAFLELFDGGVRDFHDVLDWMARGFASPPTMCVARGVQEPGEPGLFAVSGAVCAPQLAGIVVVDEPGEGRIVSWLGVPRLSAMVVLRTSEGSFWQTPVSRTALFAIGDQVDLDGATFEAFDLAGVRLEIRQVEAHPQQLPESG